MLSLSAFRRSLLLCVLLVSTFLTGIQAQASPSDPLSFAPANGYPGDVVTLTGYAFTGATQVKFNTTAAIFYTVNSDTQITAIVPFGATTGPISVTTPGGTAVSALDFTLLSVGKGKIAYESTLYGSSQIFVMNPNGTWQTNLTNTSANEYHPSFTADGRKIAFTSGRDGNWEIYSMNADGSGQTRLTNNFVTDDTPSISPDGSKITFLSNRNGKYQIYIMNADGTGQTRLTNNTAVDQSPAFSPDGRKILFESNRDGNWDIYSMNTDGTSQTRLTSYAAAEQDASFSPDGRKIVFNSMRNGNWEIYSMSADGSGQTRLTTNAAMDIFPTFSPDGSKIAFSSDRNGGMSIYVMNADGSGLTRVTTTGTNMVPAWSMSANSAPLALDDVIYNTVQEDTQFTLAAPGVLENDYDTDDDALTAELVTGPSHALSFTLNGNGSFNYQGETDFNGVDSFTYRVKDAAGAYSNVVTETLYVMAVNDTPTFTPGSTVEVLEDSGFYIQEWATDVWPGAKDDPLETGIWLKSNVTVTAGADLFADAPQITADTFTHTATLYFVPAADAHGTATVTVSFTDNDDPGLTSSTATFSIIIDAVNDVPTFTLDGKNETIPSTATTLQTVQKKVAAFSPGPADEAGQTVSFLVSADIPGIFAVQPSIDATGALTYQLKPGIVTASTATVTVQAQDNGGVDTSAPQTFTITVNTLLSGVDLQPDSANDPLAGNTLTFNAIPTGGINPEYAYKVTRKSVVVNANLTLGSGIETLIAYNPLAPYTGGPSLSFSAADAGIYTITVYCREAGLAKPLVKSKTISYTVGTHELTGITGVALQNQTTTTIALDAIPFGLDIAATVTGDNTGAVRYFVTGKLKDLDVNGAVVPTTAFNISTSYDTNPVTHWAPTMPGVYTLTVTAYDHALIVKYSKTLTVTLLAPALKGIDSFTVLANGTPVTTIATDQIPAEGLLLTPVIIGGGADAQFFYSATRKVYTLNPDGVTLTTTTTPVTLSTVFAGDNPYAWQAPIIPGAYTIKVTVKDATYNTAFTRTLTLTVTAADMQGIAGFTAQADGTPIATIAQDAIPNTGIQLVPTVTGGGVDAHYFYSATRRYGKLGLDGKTIVTVTDPVTISTAYTDAGPYAWKAALLPGVYTVTVKVYDAGYNRSVTKTLSLKVTPAAVFGIAGFTTQANGAPVTTIAQDAMPSAGIMLVPEILGGGADAQYYYSATRVDYVLQPDGKTLKSVVTPVILSTAYTAGEYAFQAPVSPGTYTFTVKVYDATFTMAYTKTTKLTVTPSGLTGISALTPDAAYPTGSKVTTVPVDGVTFTTNTTPAAGAGWFQYQVSTLVGRSYVKGVAGVFTTSNTVQLPALAGTYQLTVVGYDSTFHAKYTANSIPYTIVP